MEPCPECNNKETIIVKEANPYVFFRCPQCGHEWNLFAPDAERAIQYEPLMHASIDEDEEEDIDEDDSDNIFSQSISYANRAVSELLKELIKNFDSHNINSDQLLAICSMYKVTNDYKKYAVNGYLRLDIKEIETSTNFTFQEIIIDADGLRLTNGGYMTGDTYSEEVFPIDDEDEAENTISIIDDFISDFYNKLNSENKELDAFDSDDGIEDLED